MINLLSCFFFHTGTSFHGNNWKCGRTERFSSLTVSENLSLAHSSSFMNSFIFVRVCVCVCRDEDAPAQIPDEDAVKPDGWLDDEPEYIGDPDAIKPEDW